MLIFVCFFIVLVCLFSNYMIGPKYPILWKKRTNSTTHHLVTLHVKKNSFLHWIKRLDQEKNGCVESDEHVWFTLVHPNETPERRWCENHVIYILVKFVHVIWTSLIRSMKYEEIRVCMNTMKVKCDLTTCFIFNFLCSNRFQIL